MKILCFSDTHGDTRFIRSALAMHPDADAVFFLGDGLADIEHFVSERKCPWYFVRGNCDHFGFVGNEEAPRMDTVTLGGKRITYTHGDLYGAKAGKDGLISLALNTGADIVLYGHTHTPHESYERIGEGGVYLFNPGAASYSYHKSPHFGVITLEGKTPLFSHGAFT